METTTRLPTATMLVTLALAHGCTGTGSSSEAALGSPYQEIYDQGLTRYVGTPVVHETSVNASPIVPTIKVHHFASTGPSGERGPICMRGTDFLVETREGSSNDLVIFLEGGGVCLDEICAATAEPTLTLQLLTAGDLVGIGGIMDHTDRRNPIRNADIVHVPYCDGSFFTGDVDRPLSDGDASNGTNDPAFQRGLLNLTAALEVAKATHPNPSRVIIAGASGGAYGSIAGIALTRYYYPSTPMINLADSGPPILRGADDPDFVERALEQINALQYIPASCTDCLANGDLTKVFEWALERDLRLRVGVMTHAQDHVIGGFFMQRTPQSFSDDWVAQSNEIKQRFPLRFFRFIAPGSFHTFTLDVDAVGTGPQKLVQYLFGPSLFTGQTISRAELATWILGKMAETSQDARGNTVTGYEWLTAFLAGAPTAYDAVQLE